MKLQFNNKIISSFMLTLDHTILSKGEAFVSGSGRLYPVTGTVYGLNAYATPYKQLVHDASISGVIIMSGIYVSGQFIVPGQSGLVSLNIQEGIAYFSGRPTDVSGIFSAKEINVYLSTEPEEKLLFETKMLLKPEYPQTITGLSPSQQTFPVIFIKPLGNQNVPFCLGGTDNKQVRLRAIILAKSQFQLQGICSMLEDLANKKYPLINVTGLPFDALGGYTGVNYNYDSAISGVTDTFYIQYARSSPLGDTRELNRLNPGVFPAFVDFELWNFIG